MTSLDATSPSEPRVTAREGPQSIGHLVVLPGQQWAVWRDVGLRGAGFPSNHVLRLAAPRCAAAADQLAAAERAAIQRREQAIRTLESTIEQSPDAEGAVLRSTLQRVRRGHPRSAAGNDEMPALSALGEAERRLAQAEAEYAEAYTGAQAESAAVLRGIASDRRFREAITWQNRQAVHNSVDSFLRSAADRHSSEQRRRQELIARYLQRYCVKNDTIGFFGPVGWARWRVEGSAIAARPGRELTARRRVYFEAWCIDALAAALNTGNRLRPWLPPARLPYIHLDGCLLSVPSSPPVELSPGTAAVLAACDGRRPAQVLAQDLIRQHAGLFVSEADVYAVLDGLAAARRIVWSSAIPLETPHPERLLTGFLEGITDEAVREECLAQVGVLEAAREAVAAAAGDPDRLDETLSELESTFTELTGVAAVRSRGRAYAGRTLVYEDCVRDLELDLGPELLGSLLPPLSLLLDSVRWLTCQFAALYRRLLGTIYDDLASRQPAASVDGSTFWLAAQEFILKDDRVAESLLSVFQKRWWQILALPEGIRDISFTVEQLLPRVKAAFRAGCPGWRGARYHSPDVMVAASSLDAIRAGEYRFVLGEIHAAMNSLASSFFVSSHPSPEDLFVALEDDLQQPGIVPDYSGEWAGTDTRTQPYLISRADRRLTFSRDSRALGHPRALPIASLVVERTSQGLMVRSRDGSLCLDIVEALAGLIEFHIVHAIHLLAACPHLPRITIDRLVVCRESWTIPTDTMHFIGERDEARRFVAIRQWAQEYDMPRFAFVKVPTERKPVYVDFDSPVYVSMFWRMVRSAHDADGQRATITVTEMLPDLSQTWLPDGAGERYTAELRMVFVDRSARHGGGDEI